MKNMMKKALIFVLVALIAKPAYPVFGVSAAGSTLSRWGMGALSGMVNGAKNHPWLTGTVVTTALLVAGGVYLYIDSATNIGRSYAEDAEAKRRTTVESIKRNVPYIREHKLVLDEKQQQLVNEIIDAGDSFYNNKNQVSLEHIRRELASVVLAHKKALSQCNQE